MELVQSVDPAEYLHVLLAAYTKQYSEESDEWTNDLSMRCVPALVQGQLKLPHHARALDIGCGAGRDVEYLSEIFDAVVGIDIVRNEAWDRIAGDRDSSIRFVCTDLFSYVCVDPYDLILDNGCFHHQHEQHHAAYLLKVASMMVSDGHFVLSTFKNPTKDEHVDANGRLHKYFKDDELHQKLGAAGLEVVRELDIYRAAKGDYYRLSFCRRETQLRG